MAFSFNPGQPAQAPAAPVSSAPASGGMSAPQGGMTPPPSATPDTSLAIPDSPFLFMQQRGQEMSIMAYVQIGLILASILSVMVAVTLFAYSTYLTASIKSKQEELLAADATFKEYPVEDMKRLSLRFNVLGELLKNYVSTRSPLKLLEDVVEKQVVFQKYSLTRDVGSGGYIMNFNIATTNYRALIQQLAALNLAQYSKVVPNPKIGTVASSNSENGTLLVIAITTPVFVQGVLSDEIVFINTASSTQQQTISNATSTSTTTP